MVYKFVVTLKNKNRKLIDSFSLLLMTASVLFFLQTIITRRENYFILALVAAIIIITIVNMVRQLKSSKPVSLRLALFITGVTWFLMPQFQWVGIVVMLLAMIERQSKFPLEIGFTDEFVTMNSIFRKRFQWADFNNIILTGGYLTLDFRNDRLIQQEVLDDEEDDAEEEEFNLYCQSQLKKAIQ